MSHHASNFDMEMMDRWIERNNGKIDLGATGQFPSGKLTKQDQGEIKIGVMGVDGNIIMEFGQSVHWIGMTGVQAIDLGRILIKRGRKILNAKNS